MDEEERRNKADSEKNEKTMFPSEYLQERGWRLRDDPDEESSGVHRDFYDLHTKGLVIGADALDPVYRTWTPLREATLMQVERDLRTLDPDEDFANFRFLVEFINENAVCDEEDLGF